jgi:nucleotide-binding universal stress UspA family protein
VKILIAVDSSDASHHMVTAVQALFPNDEHLIISAASVAPYLISDPLGGGGYIYTPSNEDLRASEHLAEAAVDTAQAFLGADTDSAVNFGAPGAVICDEAREVAADVVVVGHRHKGWISRLFDPSVSDYVVRHAPCPVLVVREQAD